MGGIVGRYRRVYSKRGFKRMIFLYIIFGIFFWYLFAWLFRIIFLLFIIRLAGKLKKQVEEDIKRKIDNVKGALKENGENMSDL
jgi:hypothetical protein